MTKTESLVETLWAEVFQTERSAVLHCGIEAERLGLVPPAAAMQAVSAHARRVEPEIHALASRRGIEEKAIGKAVGSLFSKIRDGFADLTLTTEQSYRGTMLGMRHGYDAVTLFGAAAEAEGDTELAAWCRGWLAERAPLIETCARELAWFAKNPERALRRATNKVG